MLPIASRQDSASDVRGEGKEGMGNVCDADAQEMKGFNDEEMRNGRPKWTVKHLLKPLRRFWKHAMQIADALAMLWRAQVCAR